MRYLLAKVEQQECPEPGCSAAARESSIVKVAELGTDSSKAGGEYGAKLTAVVDKIKSIPQNERILVFVQFSDLMMKA